MRTHPLGRAFASLVCGVLLLCSAGRPVLAAEQEELIEIDPGEAGLVITESGVPWAQQHRVDLFHNSRMGEPVIEPGVQGSYCFELGNTAGFALAYTLQFVEENPAGIPMEYRLEGPGGWLTGDDATWVPLNGERAYAGELAAGGQADYTLHWRWPYEGDEDQNSLDTGLGEQATGEELPYILALRIVAEGEDNVGSGPAKGAPSGQSFSPAGTISIPEAAQAGAGASARSTNGTGTAGEPGATRGGAQTSDGFGIGPLTSALAAALLLLVLAGRRKDRRDD